jgi:hypothetical protein
MMCCHAQLASHYHDQTNKRTEISIAALFVWCVVCLIALALHICRARCLGLPPGAKICRRVRRFSPAQILCEIPRPYRANNPPSLVLEINQAYRDCHGVLEMTGDTLTLVVLLVGGVVLFLGAIWYIERRGNRASRQKTKRQRRKFKL